MPSPGEDIQAWSVTAANNGNADPLINWVEGQTRKSVNNSSRSELAAHAKNRNLNNYSIVTTGTANAQQFLSGLTYTSIPTNLMVRIKIGAGLTNTGPTTINMDGLGDVVIKSVIGGLDLKGGELIGDGYTDLLYNGTNWINIYSPSNIAPVNSPVLSGDPQAPTPPDPNDNDNSIATTQWVQQLVYGGQGIVLAVQTFKTAGTFTYSPTTGMKTALIECIGGGGAGGVGHNDYAPSPFLCQGGGGGSGGYSRALVKFSEITGGGPVQVIVGAGGASNGANGQATIVRLPGPPPAPTTVFCQANGGSGGSNNNSLNFGGGGGGGLATAAIGDITAAGAPGEGGTYLYFALAPDGVSQQFDCATGGGGSSIFGGGAAPVLVGFGGGVANGNPGRSYGSGGGGGASGLYGQFGSGGAGSAGIIIITEFAGVGVPGPSGPVGPQGPQGPAGADGAGAGNVISSGTPTVGQYAVWTDATHIQGVAPPSVITDWTTGDVKLTFKIVADTGWLMMNDQTIGKGTSAANYANDNCLNLYTLIWTNVADGFAPVSGGRGASAAADWAANKTLKLPLTLGRALSGAGTGTGLTARVPGEARGAESVVVPVPQHNHGVSDPGHTHTFGGYSLAASAGSVAVDGGGTYNVALYGAAVGTTSPKVTSLSVSNSGTAGATMSVLQPTAFLNVMIKL